MPIAQSARLTCVQVTGTRVTDPAVDLHDLPRIDLICLSHYHAYLPPPLLSPHAFQSPAPCADSASRDHFDQKVEASLRRDLPIITTPHAKAHLAHKPGDGEAFTAVHDLDFFESIMVDVVSNVQRQPMQGKPAIKVTGMPGKHVPPGVLGMINDLVKAVSMSLAGKARSGARLIGV